MELQEIGHFKPTFTFLYTQSQRKMKLRSLLLGGNDPGLSLWSQDGNEGTPEQHTQPH